MNKIEPDKRLRVLILSSDCNPEWPSLPVVGYNYAIALSETCDVVVATQIRNRVNILKRHPEAGSVTAGSLSFVFIDTEYIAAPLSKLSKILRGGDQVAWSTAQIMAYPSYVEFERQVWKRFQPQLDDGAFDIVHRITPMSPTMPSYMAGRAAQPFVIGPLNGNLPWPAAFATEQKREREMLRKLRGAYKYMPFARRTYSRADCILAAFQHTIDDLASAPQEKIVMFPEVGYDPAVFHPPEVAPPSDGPVRFLFAGRLVPYKLPEVAVRAFAGSDLLREHVLHVVGDGPELPRLQKIAAEHGAENRIHFEGRVDQAAVAGWMRRCDAFVFPSIRELGAGVVVEAMASGMLCLVVDYGGPADLIAPDRGVKIPLGDVRSLVEAFRREMEACADPQRRDQQAQQRRNAIAHARDRYDWKQKASFTEEIYRTLLAGTALRKDYYR